MTPLPAADDSLVCARARVVALQAMLEAQECQPVRLIETHISWVLLAGTLAYKFKKPVRLPFLDFTTLAARRRFCDEELRLNRRLAPALYLDVVEVRDHPHGPAFGGTGRVLDVAVRMRRFPDGALWSEMLAAGTLVPQHIDAMAQKLWEFHRDAAVAPPGSAFGTAAGHQRVTAQLIDSVEAWLADATPPDIGKSVDWPRVRAWLNSQLQALMPLWEQRLSTGMVRECHGDLHLANVLQWRGEAVAFDGIEFDDGLRWIDVLHDIAFLSMDLLANGQRALAFRLVNTWLEASGDYDGLPALRFYLVSRALVRAQVTALGERLGKHLVACCGPSDYLALASALSGGADPRLAITHGLPGSGKSFVSQQLIEAAGAIRVRADVERKRLFGLSALQNSRDHVPGGIYGAAPTARSYARLLRVAQIALRASWPVIVDAAFLQRSERAPFAALAASLRVPFTLVDCRAALPVLRERVAQRTARGGDPSEADTVVLERMIAVAQPLDAQERAMALVVDAAQPVPATVLVQRWLGAESAPPQV